MSRDAEIERLNRDYVKMREEVKLISDRVRRRHQEAIRQEIAREKAEAEGEFAASVARALRNGVPGTAIQDEVLHTRSWQAWKKWRDMSGVGDLRAEKRAEKQAQAEEQKALERGWEIRGRAAYVLRVEGKVLSEPVRVEVLGSDEGGTKVDSFSLHPLLRDGLPDEFNTGNLEFSARVAKEINQYVKDNNIELEAWSVN